MIPASLQANPSLDRWVEFPAPGVARIAFGKVEYGQGALTALAQIAAEELDVSMGQVQVANAATGAVPDEGMTVGSMSIEISGASVRAACAEVRALFVAEAARRLDCAEDQIDIREGAFLREGASTGETYWTLSSAIDLAQPPSGKARWKSQGQHRLVGRSEPRLDLPAKMFGGGFIQDLVMPGMRHARVLRQPGSTARLVRLDEAAARRAAQPADLDILVEGSFVAFISSSEAAAARAHAAVELTTQWDTPRDLAPELSEAASLKDMATTELEEGAPVGGPANRKRLQAAYSRPYISHGSMSPSCGIGHFTGGRLTVWTHAQGVYPPRMQIARITGLAPEAIQMEHAQGAGCYGHNGAEDAAYDAAFIASRRPGAPIRVQWRREDEFGHSPVSTAMRVEMAAELDASGRLVDWTTEIWTNLHVNRGRTLIEPALPQGPPDLPPPNQATAFGGRLNAVPSYDIEAVRVKEHLVVNSPVRTSSLRGLGGPVNTYAGECFLDEIAEAAGQDPLAFRLGMLSDPRARAVVTRIGELCGWAGRGAGGEGQGLGLAYDRHRDRGAYVAVAARVSVDEEVRLEHLWCVADAGLIINPDGAKNQIEGGMVMAASWALKEQVKLEGRGVASVTWDDYPILRFDEVPPIDVELIVPPGAAPAGIGEISLGPCLAAIGNAVAHALGARLRDLPYTRDRIARALLAG